MEYKLDAATLYSNIDLADSQNGDVEHLSTPSPYLEEFKSEIRMTRLFSLDKEKDWNVATDQTCFLDLDQYDRLKTEDNPNPDCNLLLVVLGFGSNFDMLADKIMQFGRNLPKFRKQKDHCHKTPLHIKVLDWRGCLDTALKQNIEKTTLNNHGPDRKMLNEIPSELLFYLRPEHSCTIINEVVYQANRCYRQFKEAFPNIRVSLAGHSLGSVILYDIVAQNYEKKFVGRKPPKDLVFEFPCDQVFLIGSPLSIFQSVNGERIKPLDKNGCRGFYNIFHPNDLLAYRVEPLIESGITLDPVAVSYVAGNDLKKLAEPRKSVLSFLAFCSMRDKNEKPDKDWNPPKKFTDRAVSRYDYILSGSILEYVLESLRLFGSHWDYWDNEDLFCFLLNKMERKPEKIRSFSYF